MILRMAVLLAIAFALVACDESTSSGPAPEPTFDGNVTIYQEYIERNDDDPHARTSEIRCFTYANNTISDHRLRPIEGLGDGERESMIGNQHCRTLYDLSNDMFLITFYTERGPTPESTINAESHVEIPFSIDIDAAYKLSGFYDVDDLGADNGYVSFEVRLAGPDDYLFESFFISDETIDEYFSLLDTYTGDHGGSIDGSTTGILKANEIYILHMTSTLHTQPEFASTLFGAEATGEVRIDFSAVEAAP